MRVVLFFLLITGSVMSAQEMSIVKGKLLNTNQEVAQVSVVNITTRRGTVTDEQGTFKIPVSVGDIIEIRAVQFKPETIFVTQTIIENDLLEVFMTSEVNQLDAVQLSNSILTGDIVKDGSARGLDESKINNNPDSSNPIASEYRRLHTANTRSSDQVGQNNLRLDISLDRILNALSGRTKRLKKAIEISEFQKKVDKIRNYYADSLFMVTLRIPKDHIDDFTIWVLEDEEGLKNVKLDNKLAALEYFLVRSEEYMKLVKMHEGHIIKED